MKALLVIGVLVGGAVYGLMESGWLEATVDCPACFATGRVLPPTSVCGSAEERSTLQRNTPEHGRCFRSAPCKHCEGAGSVKESQAPHIPPGLHQFDDLSLHTSSVQQ